MFSYSLAIADARRFNCPDPIAFNVLDLWASWLPARAGNVTSQNGEDGLLAALFERIGTSNRWCFEVGASDGVDLSNTWALRQDGWQAVLIEADDQKFAELERRFRDTAYLVQERIGPASLDRILSCVGAPRDLDLGIIDIDGQDLYVWEGLELYRPRVMLVEINCGGDGLLWPGGPWQAGRDSIVALGCEKGYRPLLACGCNVLFMDEDIKIA